MVNATTSTVTNWEKNRTSPTLEFLPKAVKFLGYNPIQKSESSLGERIKGYRRDQGLSIKKLAKKLGVDPSSVAKWERGKTRPSDHYQRVLAILLRDNL